MKSLQYNIMTSCEQVAVFDQVYDKKYQMCSCNIIYRHFTNISVALNNFT